MKERVTSLTHELRQPVPFEKISSAMKTGFEEVFDVHLAAGSLISEEKELVASFEDTCFGTKEWNHQR